MTPPFRRKFLQGQDEIISVIAGSTPPSSLPGLPASFIHHGASAGPIRLQIMSRDGNPPQDANGRASQVGAVDDGRDRLHRSAVRALVQDFSPIWFTWCMNSGALAQLTHQSPYRFNGIDVIADVFLVTSLTLYVVFSTLFLLRLAWFRKEAYDEITGSFAELTFVPCWTISFMTLTSNVALIVSSASWGGYPFALVSYAMWWFVMLWNMGSLFWAFLILIRRHDCTTPRLGTSIIIPAVSVSTVGITGAVVSTYAQDLPARLAIPVMIVSFHWVGVGILIGLMLCTYLFHALLAQGWPPAPQTASMFIFVGPMGQSAACLQILGSAASKYRRFADFNKGTFLTAEAAPGVDAACTVIALLLNGLGVVFLLFAIAAMIDRALERTLVWTPSWNATIFPTATLTTSMLVFAEQMDSPAYRVVTAILTITLVFFFLLNMVMTALRIYQGKLLIVREDWRVKQRLMDQQKER